VVDVLAPWVVELQAVSKAYNVGTPIENEVLHNINLHPRAGEFCAVMGPSGSGISTLLNIIGLLDRPTRGTPAVCGEATTSLDNRALTRLRGHNIGFVFQYHHLNTAFSALENVMMPMLGAAGFPNTQMRERAAELMASGGLRAVQKPGRGQAQRRSTTACGGGACAGHEPGAGRTLRQNHRGGGRARGGLTQRKFQGAQAD
jgi:ABC-type lipoprotein export system ATPase subunit